MASMYRSPSNFVQWEKLACTFQSCPNRVRPFASSSLMAWVRSGILLDSPVCITLVKKSRSSKRCLRISFTVRRYPPECLDRDGEEGVHDTLKYTA